MSRVKWMAICCLILVLGEMARTTRAENKEESETISPWRLSIPESQIEDLKNRLEQSRMPKEEEDAKEGGNGVPNAFMNKMRTYWLEKYDWKVREKEINERLVSQYMTIIEGEKMHFVHVKSKNESATPLLVLHGWPGSVLECASLLPHLTESFHVICPSLPGYFYSEAPLRKGKGDTSAIANRISKLVHRLGYKYYMVHGGDWGAEIARWLGINDEECVGVNFSMVIAPLPFSSPFSSLWHFFSSIKLFFQLIAPSFFFTPRELANIARIQKYSLFGSAYLIQHSTAPQTVSFAYSDSPLGLAAYLWEKYYLWSDLKLQSNSSSSSSSLSSSPPYAKELLQSNPTSYDALFNIYSPDLLIDMVMMYWLPNSFSSSILIYKETVPLLFSNTLPFLHKPSSVSDFNDILVMPRSWAEEYLHITQWYQHSGGGHFPALQVPSLLAHDLLHFSSSISPLFTLGYQSPPEAEDLVGFSGEL